MIFIKTLLLQECKHPIKIMLTLTKIFHFEMAHAINGYPGSCKNIHGQFL